MKSVASPRRYRTARRPGVNRLTRAEKERALALPPAARSDSARIQSGLFIDLAAAERPRGGEPERLGDILDRLFATEGVRLEVHPEGRTYRAATRSRYAR